MNSRIVVILIGLWATSIMVALLMANGNQLKDFDPDLTLAQAASKQHFDESFADILQDAGIGHGTVVHFTANTRCFCNQLSESHQLEISNTLANSGYGFSTVSISEHPAIGNVINHFPALAVIDKLGKLRYLGPYATGLGCFTGNNLVADIARIATSEQYLGATVNTEARGCFCAA